MDDFSKDEDLKKRGASAADVCSCARTDGLEAADIIRMLRQIFSLSLAQAKEIIVVTSGTSRSLSERQEKLAPALEEALKNQGDI